VTNLSLCQIKVDFVGVIDENCFWLANSANSILKWVQLFDIRARHSILIDNEIWLIKTLTIVYAWSESPPFQRKKKIYTLNPRTFLGHSSCWNSLLSRIPDYILSPYETKWVGLFQIILRALGNIQYTCNLDSKKGGRRRSL